MNKKCPKCEETVYIKRWIALSNKNNEEYPWAWCSYCNWKGFLYNWKDKI
jgi:hypothetical protein